MNNNKLHKLLGITLTASLVIIVFSGNRCEKQKKGQPTTAPKDAAAQKDAAAGEPALDVAAETDVPDAAEIPVEAADATVEATDAPADPPEEEEVKTITFKKIPKIPSFKPSKKQPVADPEEYEYLSNHEKTCKILAEGKWSKRKGKLTLIPMRRERIADGLSWRFKILLALSDEDEAITGFFKPRQDNYWDWLKETHAYNIGRMIDAPTVPTVLRFFSKNSFSWWLNKTPAEETKMFKWEGKKNPKIRGALKYWVPSYWHRRFGKKIANKQYMAAIARSLHPGNSEKLEEKYPLYLEIGRGIIFDYLIINEDRPENLGTILLPDGSHKLVMIDNGLALGVEHGGRTVMKNMFLSMRLFPKDMIEKIKALDDDEILEMLRPPDDPPMWLPEICVKQLIKRKQVIINHVDKWHEKWGNIIWY